MNSLDFIFITNWTIYLSRDNSVGIATGWNGSRSISSKIFLYSTQPKALSSGGKAAGSVKLKLILFYC
jgi:hypothetical protein